MCASEDRKERPIGRIGPPAEARARGPRAARRVGEPDPWGRVQSVRGVRSEPIQDLDSVKQRLADIDSLLPEHHFYVFGIVERNGRFTRVLLTEGLRKSCRKAGVWLSRPLCAALRNATLGFDANQPRSRGGRDGIFRVDRTHRPENEMMRKLFAGFLDKEDGEVKVLAGLLGAEVGQLIPVRVVSHHLRLLGVLFRDGRHDHLLLVDCDQ